MKFLNYFSVWFLVHFVVTINIVTVKKKKKNYSKRIGGNKNSIFSQICTKVLTTFHYIGENGMEIYKYCSNKYELLSSNNSWIRKDNPICFHNLNSFYCDYSVSEHKEDNDWMFCQDTSSKKKMLDIIKGCINEELNNLPSSSRMNKCPTLNYKNFKIMDKKEFCKFAERRISLDTNDEHSMEYTIIESKQRRNCEFLVESYNSCVQSEFLLFPSSNYQKCFSANNLIYMCSITKRMNRMESNLCSNYVLPSLAYTSLQLYLPDEVIKYHCEGYENKIVNQYDSYIEKVNTELNYIESFLQNFNNLIRINEHLSMIIRNNELEISKLNKIWINFFPLLSISVRNKRNFSYGEMRLLINFRKHFDQFLPYVKRLRKYSKDPSVLLSNFTDLHQPINKYYVKTNFYINQLIKIVTVFDEMLRRKNTTSLLTDELHVADHNKIKQDLNYQELMSFQNEFLTIELYLKEFNKWVRKNIDITNQRIDENSKSYKEKALKLRDIIRFISQQKQSLFNYILTEINEELKK